MHRVYLVCLSIPTIIQLTRSSSHNVHLHPMSTMMYSVCYFARLEKERKIKISQYWWKLLSWNKFNSLVFHPFSIRKQQNYIVRYIIYSENMEDKKASVSLSTDLRNPPPLFSGSPPLKWNLYKSNFVSLSTSLTI